MRRLIAAVIGLSFLLASHSASALSRYECRGLTQDKIVLTPYSDGSVNLSFNDGPVAATTKFSYKGDVFTAIFKDISGVKGALLAYIIDGITRNGYELFDLPSRGAGSAKMTCWLYK